MSIAPAIRVAARAAAKAGGKTVSIERGSGARIECVPFGLGSSTFETVSAEGAIVLTRSQDFLILAELYDFGAGPVEPARGDKIILEQADGEHTYELLDLANAPCWRWSDPYQQRLRIHTKEVAKPS